MFYIDGNLVYRWGHDGMISHPDKTVQAYFEAHYPFLMHIPLPLTDNCLLESEKDA